VLHAGDQEAEAPDAILAVRPTTLTVDHERTGDPFGYWREQWCEGTVGVTGERPRSPAPDPGSRFRAEATHWTTGHVIRLRCRTSPFEVSRGPAQIKRLDWQDWIWLYQELSDGAVFRHGDNDFATRRGDLLLTDPTVPFSCRPYSTHDYRRWFLPRRWIEPHLPRGHRPLSVQLADDAGLYRLVRSYLAALDEAIDSLEADKLPAVIDNFCRLLALACGATTGSAMGSPREAVRAARLRQVRDYVERHLSDPELSPARAAAAAHISVRQLHLLFEPTGASFAQHVLARRLQECRAALESPAHRGRTVTDIAFAWGFNNLASFYRAFRRAFGVGPGDVRTV
jgi:AraC-like DNA-binding protein